MFYDPVGPLHGFSCETGGFFYHANLHWFLLNAEGTANIFLSCFSAVSFQMYKQIILFDILGFSFPLQPFIEYTLFGM